MGKQQIKLKRHSRKAVSTVPATKQFHILQAATPQAQIKHGQIWKLPYRRLF